MNATALRLVVPAALMLGLSACAGSPEKIEDPHHYSRDRDGRRVACYTTDVVGEYECEPARAGAPYGYPYAGYGYDPFWDPWWSYGFGYQWWGWEQRHAVVYPYPASRAPRGRR